MAGAAGETAVENGRLQITTGETAGAFRGLGETLPQGELFGSVQGMPHLPPKQLLFWTLAAGVSSEDALAELRAASGLEFSVTWTVDVAGFSGIEFDASAERQATIPALGTLVGHSGPWHTTNSSQVNLRFIVLDVAGRTLVIYTEAPQDEFEEFLAEAEQVLRTIEFDIKAASSTVPKLPVSLELLQTVEVN